MRLTGEDAERAQRGELVCHGCFSHKVAKVCATCGHYFCVNCYGDVDWCLWCEAEYKENEHEIERHG